MLLTLIKQLSLADIYGKILQQILLESLKEMYETKQASCQELQLGIHWSSLCFIKCQIDLCRLLFMVAAYELNIRGMEQKHFLFLVLPLML